MTSINDYVCNLIAGRGAIDGLYYAVDRARDQRSNSKNYCYKANFAGIGIKTYNAAQLVQLDTTAFCTKMSILIAEAQANLNVDNYIKLLLKARNTILNLYQTRYRAMFMKSTARIFCYTFVNPFGAVAGVSTNKLGFNNATTFLNFFCLCEGNRFDPLLVLGGI